MRTGPIVCAAFASAVFVLASPSSRAQSVATDPIGFVTLSIAAASAGSEQLSFRSLNLSRPVEYQGAAETATNTGGNSTLFDNEAAWAANQFSPAGATADSATHYVEIVRPAGSSTAVAGEGTTYDILATDGTTKTLTLAGNLPVGVAGTSSVSFRIRRYWTIADVFGTTNQAGLQAGAQGEADEILIYSPQTSQFNTYYYRLGGIGGDSWRNALTGAPAATQKIYPEDGLIIRRRQTTRSTWFCSAP